MAKTATILRLGLVALTALSLSACASIDSAGTAPPVSRALDPAGPIATPRVEPASEVAVPVHVTEIDVKVPRTLKVSERNSYLPRGDIVWQEDPPGDRYEQVAGIVLAGLAEGVKDFNGPRGVKLLVEVARFHALTKKARYTFGGVHAIQFYLTVLDAETGEPIVERRFIKADFKALGGQAAVAAEAQGITQKVRITRHLAEVIRQEFTRPEGYHAENTGIIGLLNQG
ncbi:hypothetical protein SAMN05216257_102392 [Meinhardsimonia xiamenensis]|jgi:hypothetical protein|uniref:Lipoprotein n=1 Tax=Meinhardsimonia xiamenensis TaxID=990712 RepID=A0A1G9B3Q8_9RHOB|nr:DUF6778 family protein [Meinhardsimonia xiamenensis]PRX35133.1 hypothetical protein LV81_01727 [Meinhardsimonia xiamenensis]SDK34157.1 hypothetical protein SAMN05216257_102392 [Meinhardsimonia xiamenensis]